MIGRCAGLLINRSGLPESRPVTLGNVSFLLPRPLEPMLARVANEPPPGQYYEPKWDGFRTLAFRDGDDVALDSRNGRELTRFFPEIVQAVRTELPDRCVVDGEIILIDADGELDFGALQLRLHPAASRIDRLARETPCHFVAFDLLAIGDEDLTNQPFERRRARLSEVITGAGRVQLTPMTDELALAQRWFTELEGAGLDGLIAKASDLRYQPGKRVMTKIKHRRTAECVVAGYRPHKNDPHAVGSLLLGLYLDPEQADELPPQWRSEGSVLVPVGVVGSFPMARRRAMIEEFAPLVCEFSEHPWNWAGDVSEHETQSFGSRWNPDRSLSFVPVRPVRVVEVRYDAMAGTRFRHLAQFERWRPDREPLSCGFDQIERPVPRRVVDVLDLGMR